ncbi:cysteine-rich with EGF-like domain protein 2 isoform X2 [Amia ocellicauda]|uniref:cysteine-rich with EGF-like domain protein 2 isoform X2 n=1 Tax=Amia ocellicauda TaxID=2972642 RepID=UPI003464E39C
MQSFTCVVTFLSLAVLLCCQRVDARDVKEPCVTCRTITDNFAKGFDRTAKKNFGGGNTAWEERKLSKYETSEIRLVEIIENLCDSSSFECNQMVEEHEEHFETWWFKKKEKYPDLFKWFCIDTIEVCCPKGTFGPDCNACVGGSERPCHGSGVCNGDGTRKGTGRCSCNRGYQGEFCLDCAAGFFSEERNDTFSLCTECHVSCKTCTGATNQECEECKTGWTKDDEGACNACDKACAGCVGKGPENCTLCASGYDETDGSCTDIDECNLEDKVCVRENEDCVNTQGSYKCYCSSGFEDKEGVCEKIEDAEENVEETSDSLPDSPPASPQEPHEDL